MAETYVTLSSSAPLLCQIGLKIDRPLADVAAEITTLAHETRITEHYIHATFRDPLDAVLGWRHLDTRFGTQLSAMSIAASENAVEMLRDPFATATWAWLMARGTGPRAHAGETGATGLFGVCDFSRFEFRRVPIEICDHRLPNSFGLTLAVADLDHPERVIHLTEPGFVGRLVGATIQLKDANISKRHVELGVDSQEGWFVRDARSAGGFWIADRRAGSARHTLHPGMVLQLAHGICLVVLSVR